MPVIPVVDKNMDQHKVALVDMGQRMVALVDMGQHMVVLVDMGQRRVLSVDKDQHMARRVVIDMDRRRVVIDRDRRKVIDNKDQHRITGKDQLLELLEQLEQNPIAIGNYLCNMNHLVISIHLGHIPRA
jgi:hypothetical protein